MEDEVLAVAHVMGSGRVQAASGGARAEKRQPPCRARVELAERDGEHASTRIGTHGIPTSLLCAHVMAERHAAHEDVEDLARVVARAVRVQPLVQLRAPIILRIYLGVLVILARVLGQVGALACGEGRAP